MKNVFALAVCFAVLAVAAFAADAPPYLTANPEPGNTLGGGGHSGTDATLVDNLITSGGQVTNGLSGCTYHSSWLALDYTPTSSVTVKQITFDYIYNSARLKNSINFRLYSGATPGGSIIRSWTVPASAYTETSTGWIAFSRTIYRAVVPIPDQALTGSTKYWFAYTSPNSAAPNIVYWCVRAQLKELQVYWYLNSRWGTCRAQGGGGDYEQSYAIYDTQTGVEPVSLGKVKTLFK
ncbi:MAG: hypothetical protein V3T41_06510 [bacterium]